MAAGRLDGRERSDGCRGLALGDRQGAGKCLPDARRRVLARRGEAPATAYSHANADAADGVAVDLGDAPVAYEHALAVGGHVAHLAVGAARRCGGERLGQ